MLFRNSSSCEAIARNSKKQLLCANKYNSAFQGTLFWALFVLGHDCGHGSFSPNSVLNDAFGNLLHCPLLVPYYPWKVSHRRHHKNTGNMDRDEIFYPIREKDSEGRKPGDIR